MYPLATVKGVFPPSRCPTSKPPSILSIYLSFTPFFHAYCYPDVWQFNIISSSSKFRESGIRAAARLLNDATTLLRFCFTTGDGSTDPGPVWAEWKGGNIY